MRVAAPGRRGLAGKSQAHRVERAYRDRLEKLSATTAMSSCRRRRAQVHRAIGQGGLAACQSHPGVSRLRTAAAMWASPATPVHTWLPCRASMFDRGHVEPQLVDGHLRRVGFWGLSGMIVLGVAYLRPARARPRRNEGTPTPDSNCRSLFAVDASQVARVALLLLDLHAAQYLDALRLRTAGAME